MKITGFLKGTVFLMQRSFLTRRTRSIKIGFMTFVRITNFFFSEGQRKGWPHVCLYGSSWHFYMNFRISLSISDWQKPSEITLNIRSIWGVLPSYQYYVLRFVNLGCLWINSVFLIFFNGVFYFLVYMHYTYFVTVIPTYFNVSLSF